MAMAAETNLLSRSQPRSTVSSALTLFCKWTLSQIETPAEIVQAVKGTRKEFMSLYRKLCSAIVLLRLAPSAWEQHVVVEDLDSCGERSLNDNFIMQSCTMTLEIHDMAFFRISSPNSLLLTIDLWGCDATNSC